MQSIKMLTVKEMRENNFSFSKIRAYYSWYAENGFHKANKKAYTSELNKLRYLVKKENMSWKRIMICSKTKNYSFNMDEFAKAA